MLLEVTLKLRDNSLCSSLSFPNLTENPGRDNFSGPPGNCMIWPSAISVIMSSHGIPSVDTCSVAIKTLLNKARNVNVDLSIEPALSAADLTGYVDEIGNHLGASFIANNPAHFAATETACRNIFYDLLVRPSSG